MPGLNMGYGRINADYFNLIKISSTDMLLIQANGDSGLGDLLFEIYINDQIPPFIEYLWMFHKHGVQLGCE